MGTYTTNKNLYMPTVGEQGWGTLVNGNFETIDTFLKPISLSGSTYTFTGNQTGGSINATSITNSGTLTQTGTSTFTGKITANGGIGTKALTTTSISNSGALTQTGASTFTGLITANGGVKGKIVSKYYNNGNILGLSMNFPAVSLSKKDSLEATSSIPLNFVRSEVVSNLFIIEEDSANLTVTFTFTYTYVPGYHNNTCGFGLYDSNGTELYRWTQYNQVSGITNATATITLPLKPASYSFKKIGPVGTATTAKWAISAMSLNKYVF